MRRPRRREGSQIPVTELQNQAGPASLIGLVGGYLAGNPARKRAQAQREFEQKRETAGDQRAAQELANNTMEATDRHTAAVDMQTQLAAKNLAHAQEAKVIGAEPPYDPQNPNAWLAWAMKASHYYATSDPEYAKHLAEEARYGANPLGQEARATRDVAGAGLDKARTQQITQWKTRADYAFKQKMAELQATANGRAQIAGMNQAAAFARAQLSAGAAMARTQASQGGAMARAQMSEDERTLIAEMTALNVANGQDQARAYQTAKTQYDGQMKQWTQDQETGRAAAAGGRTPPSDYQQPAPTFNISMPSSQAPQNSIIVVPMPQPNGQVRMVPIVNRRPASGGGGAAPGAGGSAAAIIKASGVNATPAEAAKVSAALAKGIPPDAIIKALRTDHATAQPKPGATPPAGIGWL